MNTKIFKSKIIVFETKKDDALDAAIIIDGYWSTFVTLFENVAMVTFSDDVDEPILGVTLTVDDYIEECVKVLNEHNIEYKIKEIKF